MWIREGYEFVALALVLSALLSCATTQPSSVPRIPDPAPGLYPADMRARGIESDVILAVTVLPDGSTSNIVVVKSGGPEFDRAATDSMRTLRFRPATRDGVAVPCRIKWTYHFRLDNNR
jgi:protein TonB